MDDDAAPGADMTTKLVAGQGIAATRVIEHQSFGAFDRQRRHTTGLMRVLIGCKEMTRHQRREPFADADRRIQFLDVAKLVRGQYRLQSRSEERSVGKEGVNTCRSWWGQSH